jgi:hypothetical protein
MLNPWLSLPFQAARLGWETQAIIVEQLMRIASMSTPDRQAAGALNTKEMLPLAEEKVAVAPAIPSLPMDAMAPATKSEHRQVAQKLMKIHKKRGPGSKRSRSK